MTVYIEQYVPVVNDNGLNTLKNASFGGALVVTGAVTFSGAQTQKQNVISGQGATATLTAAQSGSLVLFDRAAGIIYTLPAPAVGLWFDFVVSTTITSNNAKVITDAGTTLLQGTLISDDSDSADALVGFQGNGTTHIAVTQNGSTTGGIIGTRMHFHCVTATKWNVSGEIVGSGSVATPFATS